MSGAIGPQGNAGLFQSGGNYYLPASVFQGASDPSANYTLNRTQSFDDQGNVSYGDIRYIPPNGGNPGPGYFINPSALGLSQNSGADWMSQVQYQTDPSTGQQYANLGSNPFTSVQTIGPVENWDSALLGMGALGGAGLAAFGAGAGASASAGANAAGGAAGAAGGAGGAGGDLFGGYSAADMGIGDTSGLGGGGGLFGGFSNADMGIADTVGGAGAAAGGAAGGLPSWLGPAASAGSRLLGGGAGGATQGGGGGGNPFMNFLTGQGGGPSLPGLAPGLAALQYARNQNPVDTSQLQSVFNQAGANAPLFVQAAQHPLQQAQAGGYGDILNSQAQRGIRGSSFGDQSIANYMTDTNRGIADAGTNAAQAALGLQGDLAGQISNLNALSQQMKNNLYGRAFSSLGQGLNPTPGMGGMGGAPGGGGGFPGMGGAAAGAGGLLGNLNLGGAGSAIGNAFGNGLSSIGSGLGSMFGSPGSTFWSGPAQFNPLVNGGTDSINLAGDFGLAGF